jgi:cellulose synthase (UDP-forming)
MSIQRRVQAPFPGPARIVLILLYVAVALWYLHWRIGSFNPDALTFSWVLYAAEVFGFFTSLLLLFMTWRLTQREPPLPPSDLRVDVFIPTINEPLELVRRTALAAIHMSYPHRTWLLDDGDRVAIRKLAESLGCGYLARRGNANAKAGNLNHGLAHSNGDFVAVFDADHAPSKDFLNRTLGYFSDPRVAFVQTPQDFYNLDSYQHRRKTRARTTWNEQSLFFKVIQNGRDFWNASFFCGSCGVMRRSALQAIGGFATGSVTEDLHTSIKLHKKGYRSVYHAEALAFGIAPANLVPYLTQRTRWGRGAMQVWRKEGIVFARGLTLPQRLCYLASVLTYFDGWQKAVFYIAPVVVLLTGVMPVKALGWEFFLRFVPYYLLTFLVFEEVSRGYGRTLLLAQYNMARFFAFAASTLGLFRRKFIWHVTQKNLRGQPRLKFSIAPQYAVLLLNAIAIPVGALAYGISGKLPEDALIANIAWAAINCALAISLLRFTLRHSSNKRANYRFPVPLPAKIKLAGRHAVYGTVDDISPSGCRIHARFPAKLNAGSQLEGEIYFPHGVLPFGATVLAPVAARFGAERYLKAVGCRFNGWVDSRGRDVLETFLYGSDLQARINHFEERSSTPFDRFQSEAKLRDNTPASYWAPLLLEAPWTDSPSQVALISCAESGPTARTVLTFKPLPLNCRISALIFTRAGRSLLFGKIISEERFESPVAPIYAYQLTGLIRGQKWIRKHLLAAAPAATAREAA